MRPKHLMAAIHYQIIEECMKRHPTLSQMREQFEQAISQGQREQALAIAGEMTPLLDQFKEV